MKLLKFRNRSNRSFSIQKDNNPFANNHWHSHSEMELVYFKKGSGVQFIEANIKRFESGDVFLIGDHLRHFWSFDQKYSRSGLLKPTYFVVHFSENFGGNEFLDLPEIMPIKKLFQLAKKGLIINGIAKQQVGTQIEKMALAQQSERLIYLLKILALISESNAFELI